MRSRFQFGLLVVPFSLRRWTSSSPRIEQEVRNRIGKNTELIEEETRRFLDQRYRSEIFYSLDPNVELQIQNAPEQLLLRLQGDKPYKEAFRAIRWMLWCWYKIWYYDLRVQTFKSQDLTEPYKLKLKWKIDGKPRTFFLRKMQNTPSSLLSGYSYYRFSPVTGYITLHLIDRLVPPITRTSLLFRFLERFNLLPSPPSPSLPTPTVTNTNTTTTTTAATNTAKPMADITRQS